VHANEISLVGFIAAYAAVPLSMIILKAMGVRLQKDMLISVFRMSVQLGLVGLYLTFIFDLNSPWLNIAYITLMVGAANFSLLRGSGLRLGFFKYTFPALFVAMAVVLLYYIAVVYKPVPIWDARYLVPIAGMLLGNSMNRTIITLERFYSAVRKDKDGYAAMVVMGATTREAASPYLTQAYRAGLQPSLATMGTMGIVSLPGMMTGQILGGSAPHVAIQYQITIILAIFMATEIASVLSTLLSMRYGFNKLGFLRVDVFK